MQTGLFARNKPPTAVNFWNFSIVLGRHVARKLNPTSFYSGHPYVIQSTREYRKIYFGNIIKAKNKR